MISEHLKTAGYVLSAIIGIVTLFLRWPKIVNRVREIIDRMKGTTEIKAMITTLTARVDIMHANLSNENTSLDDKLSDGLSKLRTMGDRVNLIAARQISDDFLNDSYGIFETDSIGRVRRVNPQFSRMTGLNSEEAQGGGWINIIVPEQRDTVEKQWLDAVGKQRNTEIDAMIQKNDQQSKVRIRVFLMHDAERNILGFRCRISRLA